MGLRTASLSKIEISYLRGGVEVVDVPRDDEGIDQACRLITDELEARREGNPGKKGSAAANRWLAPCCYRLIMACHADEDGQELLKNRIVRFQRYVRGQRASLHIFQTGLLAIFAHEPKLLGDQERKRLADRMWYAFRHYIPPALLEGFNHQYPRHTETGDDWVMNIEPELFDWVVEQRALAVIGDYEILDHRKRYPDDVERSVAYDVQKTYSINRTIRPQISDNTNEVIDDGW